MTFKRSKTLEGWETPFKMEGEEEEDSLHTHSASPYPFSEPPHFSWFLGDSNVQVSVRPDSWLGCKITWKNLNMETELKILSCVMRQRGGQIWEIGRLLGFFLTGGRWVAKPPPTRIPWKSAHHLFSHGMRSRRGIHVYGKVYRKVAQPTGLASQNVRQNHR